MDYVVVIEKSGDGSFSAYAPDLPGCVTSGSSVDEVRVLIEEVVVTHIDSPGATGELPLNVCHGRKFDGNELAVTLDYSSNFQPV